MALLREGELGDNSVRNAKSFPFTICCVVFCSALAHGANVVLKDAEGGFAAFERSELILTCQIAGSADSEGKAGGFLLHLDDLRAARILGDPPNAPGLRWRWTTRGPGSDAKVELIPAFERWLGTESIEESVEARFQNAWLHPVSGAAQLLETVAVLVHAKSTQSRTIDLEIKLMNVSREPVVLAGGADGAGLVASIAPTLPVTAYSVFEKDEIFPSKRAYWTPWISFDYQDQRRSTNSSFSVFQHPENPGTSSPNVWILEEGQIVISGEDAKPVSIAVGETEVFRYRMFIDSREVNPMRLEHQFGVFSHAAPLLKE